MKPILGRQFADVPGIEQPDQVTKLEEDRIVGYYGGGTLYATPARRSRCCDTDHDSRAVSGLPEPLPAGERMIWQGKPDWRALALRAFHVRKVAIYFGVLLPGVSRPHLSTAMLRRRPRSPRSGCRCSACAAVGGARAAGLADQPGRPSTPSPAGGC